MQTCFGLDYNFSNHKCFFHLNDVLCPMVDVIPTPEQLVAAPSVVNIVLCNQKHEHHVDNIRIFSDILFIFQVP